MCQQRCALEIEKAIGTSHPRTIPTSGTQQSLWDQSQKLASSFLASGAQFSGSGGQFNVGLGSIGRSSATEVIASDLTHATSGATYGTGNVTESFKSTQNGIEQSFHIANRTTGPGPLVIAVPISGLKASNAGNAVDLFDSTGQVVASYWGLRVSDAAGKIVPATMTANAEGNSITIDVRDSGAQYPLTVDPTWSQTAELTASDGAASDYLGSSVSISGTTALVGDDHDSVSGHSSQGAAYIFSESGGSWSESAKLTASDGTSGDLFGAAVTLSGSVALVGAPGHTVAGNAAEGVVYEFNESGGSWSQAAEFTDSGGAADDQFGSSLAVWGSTLIVDAGTKTVSGNNGQGAAFVFTNSGGSWSQTAELTASDGAANDEFGATSVALSGTTVVIGARVHTVDGNSDQGEAYVFTGSGGSWSQTAELTAPDGGAADFFGTAVAISGSTVMVGAPNHTVSGHEEGTVYVFNLAGSGWILSSELTSPSSGGFLFGNSLALSGPTVVIGDIGEDVGGTLQGAAYLFILNGTDWTEAAELTASDGGSGDELGYGVALSASGVVAGAPWHTVGTNADQGAAYLYSTALSVAPAPATAIATGEASKNSVGCSHSATPGDPVDCASGDFYHTFTDASIPGYGPSPRSHTDLQLIGGVNRRHLRLRLDFLLRIESRRQWRRLDHDH